MNDETVEKLSEALNDAARDAFVSTDCDDREITNITEAVSDLACSAKRIAIAITPTNASAGHDETGGHVESLTEAVMGMTAAMCKIAGALEDISSAIREHGE